MIGEMIGELTGKVVGQRIIRRHHTGELKIERTLESKGKILGIDVTFIATTKTWELYDLAMPNSLNTITSMVMGKGYWINAIRDCVCTV